MGLAQPTTESSAPPLWLVSITEGGQRVSPTVWSQSVPAVAFHAQGKWFRIPFRISWSFDSSCSARPLLDVPCASPPPKGSCSASRCSH